MVPGEGVVSQHALRQTAPPVNRMTNRTLSIDVNKPLSVVHMK